MLYNATNHTCFRKKGWQFTSFVRPENAILLKKHVALKKLQVAELFNVFKEW